MDLISSCADVRDTVDELKSKGICVPARTVTNELNESLLDPLLKYKFDINEKALWYEAKAVNRAIKAEKEFQEYDDTYIPK
mmetsp:Transcript_6228/g.7668  ORF Transcript_6228/g.7668 Transcript_6228/m.7668 type:complete len:81 (-) Transcript_6228:68-310(-)